MTKNNWPEPDATAEIPCDRPYEFKCVDAWSEKLVQEIVEQETAAPRPSQQAINLAVIRKWPEGFEARLQHVWLDVVSFTPSVKLYDLQRVLAEFGFTMTVTEPVAQPAEAVQKGGPK